MRRSCAGQSRSFFFTDKVKPIIEAVRTEGDAALVRYGRDFDGAEPLTEATLKASEAEFDAAFDCVENDVVAAIRHGIENIRIFHEEQKPEPMWFKEIKPGAFAGTVTRQSNPWRFTCRVARILPVCHDDDGRAWCCCGSPEPRNLYAASARRWCDAATLVAARTAGSKRSINAAARKL